MIADELPRAALGRDAPDERTLGAYLELVQRRRESVPAQNGRPAAPRVAALVACEAGGGDPAPTLESLQAQRGVSLGSILAVAASGTFPGAAPALASVDGVVAGWAAGLALTSDELVLLTPAGAVIEPDFLRRAAAALAAEPEIAWVTAFGTGGATAVHAPPGNYLLPLAELDASPSVALVRRAALEAGLEDGDADLFVRLGRAGAYGVVLQEPLIANLPRRATR
jgi:hypothetical protein